MSYNSKYTGAQVEEFLDQIANGEIGGGITEETDPIFSASPAASITEAKKAEWDNKVDKVSGKQLSTEDFTSALKTKLEGLSNYDDTELSEALSTLRGDFDKLVSGDTTTAIKTFNEVIAFLDGVQDTQDLASIIASIEQQIAGKMDKVTLATVATSGSYNDLSNKPIIPTNVSQLNDDRGLVDKQFAHENFIGIADVGSELKVARIDQFTTPYGSLLYAFPATANGDEDDVLLSHNTVKTINGESIVGSGNIVISGGGGSSSGSGAYAEVNHGTSDTTFTLTPNTFHVWDEVVSLTLTLGSETAGVANEFLFQFNSGATATSLTLPDDIKWANDAPPTIAENKIYQVSILKGLASVLEFANAPALIENKVTVSISGTKYLVSLQYAAASDIVVKVRTADGLISVNILSGEISKTARSVGPMVDSSAYIESITPVIDNNYNYTW